MSKPIHVSVAWPYANGDLHVGHLAGAYLPSDIFARYHRLKGNRALMVSGSPLSPRRLAEAIDRLGPVVYQGYGQTEVGNIAMLTPGDIARGPAGLLASTCVAWVKITWPGRMRGNSSGSGSFTFTISSARSQISAAEGTMTAPSRA